MKVYSRQDMIKFVEYYDGKNENNCHRTFDEELEEWEELSNKDNKCPICKTLSDDSMLNKIRMIIKDVIFWQKEYNVALQKLEEIAKVNTIKVIIVSEENLLLYYLGN